MFSEKKHLSKGCMDGTMFTNNSLRLYSVLFITGAVSACSTVSTVRPVKTDATASYERVEYKINLNVPMTRLTSVLV